MSAFDMPAPVWVNLEASLLRHQDHLEVRYRVNNCGSSPVALMDQLGNWGIDDLFEYSPDHVYVHFASDVLHLTKGILWRPAGARRREPPYGWSDGRMLGANESVDGEFDVEVPVKVRNPYLRDRSSGRVANKSAVARAVVLAVGVVPEGGGTRLVHEHPAYPEVVTVTRLDGAGVEEWQTDLTKRFELPVPLQVLDYSD